MKILIATRNHPLALALSLVLAFLVWVAWDAWSGIPRSSEPPLDAPPVDSPRAVELRPPQMIDETVLAHARDPSHPGVVTADQIPCLQPGMARVAVEGLIGQPPAGLVHPVSMVDGKLTYQALYLANLDSGPPMSVPAARTIISLEYDAGRPGHPLIMVHLPSRR